MQRKNVTWSPVVRPISRPTLKRTRRRAPSRKTYTELKFSKHSPKCAHGVLTAYCRKTTHSTLLTIRKDGHRKIQLLVDLAAQKVRRIYDGSSTWNVSRSQTDEAVTFACKMGCVHWLDEGAVREPNARGFRLDWLQGTQKLHVRLDSKTKVRKTRSPRQTTRRRHSLKRRVVSSRRA